MIIMIKTLAGEELAFNPELMTIFAPNPSTKNKIITMACGTKLEISDNMWRYAKNECSVRGLSLVPFNEALYNREYK